MSARDQTLHREPALRELLDDPVMQAVMRRDRVARHELLDLVLSTRERLGTVADSAARVAA